MGLACFGAYQLFKLPVVLPVLLAQYDYDRTLAGAFMSVYAVSGLALSVWFGRIITRRGPLFLATPAVTCIGLGAALTLVAPQFGLVVLLSRGLEGIAFAVLGIIGPVLASSHATRRQLPLILGISAAWISGWSVDRDVPCTGQSHQYRLAGTLVTWLLEEARVCSCGAGGSQVARPTPPSARRR